MAMSSLHHRNSRRVNLNIERHPSIQVPYVRRIEGEMRNAEWQKKHLIEAHRTRIESIDDRLLNLMDQRLRAIAEIEAMGDEI